MSWIDKYAISGKQLRDEAKEAVVKITEEEASQFIDNLQRNYPEVWERYVQIVQKHNPESDNPGATMRDVP